VLSVLYGFVELYSVGFDFANVFHDLCQAALASSSCHPLTILGQRSSQFPNRLPQICFRIFPLP
jgi:hypothetical protein